MYSIWKVFISNTTFKAIFEIKAERKKHNRNWQRKYNENSAK